MLLLFYLTTLNLVPDKLNLYHKNFNIAFFIKKKHIFVQILYLINIP